MRFPHVVTTAAVVTALTVVGHPGAGPAARACPSTAKSLTAKSLTRDTTAAARPVTKDYATVQQAAASVGVPLTATGQVVQTMVGPTFVDLRITPASVRCRIVGVMANSPTPLVWTPPLPSRWTNSRFVSNTGGAVTVELRTSATGWRPHTATSPSLRWTAGT